MCEERTLLLRASSSKDALVAAKCLGKAAQLSYPNSDGRQVHFEFVGVLDLRHLGRECSPDEVWYDINNRVAPMERRAALIPSDANLLARSG